MSGSFTKLHSSLLTSTLWREDPATKVVWVTLLAMADRSGVVEATVPGLAAYANVSVAETEAAIEKFMSPDKYSRTPAREGRRIEVIDVGWQLLNYEKYREKLSKEDLKQKAVIRQQRHRERAASHEESVTERDANVTECDSHEISRMSRQAEAEAEAEKPTTLSHPADELLLDDAPHPNSSARENEKPAKSSPKTSPPPDWIPVEAWSGFVEMRKKIKAPMTDRAISLMVKKLEGLKAQGFDVGEVLDQSIRNNWKDVYPLKGNDNGNSSGYSPRTQRNITALDEVKRRNAERYASA